MTKYAMLPCALVASFFIAGPVMPAEPPANDRGSPGRRTGAEPATDQ